MCVWCEPFLLYLWVQLYFTISFNRAIRFKGYQQQDSHELLRYLLDGMRAEEIQVSARVIVVHSFLLHTPHPDSFFCWGKKNMRCVSLCSVVVLSIALTWSILAKTTHRKSGFGVCVVILKNVLMSSFLKDTSRNSIRFFASLNLGKYFICRLVFLHTNWNIMVATSQLIFFLISTGIWYLQVFVLFILILLISEDYTFSFIWNTL